MALGCPAPVTPVASSSYSYIQIPEWKCISNNCLNGTKFSLMLTNTVNPPSASASLSTFLVYSTSPAGNAEYRCMINATPDLEIGPLYNLNITQHDADYVLSSTNYTVAFTTSSDIPINGEFLFYFPNKRIFKESGQDITISYSLSGGAKVDIPSG